jgi:pimeloyl-ACP methyl ester carboxylesterase
MSQLVFIHGPGAGACGEGYAHQLSHFPGSLAPDLPGHLEGKACNDVARYAEWLRGWLWYQNLRSDLILVGFTLGSCIAIQYALDYPEEVKGLVLMTVSMRSKGRGPDALNMRLDAVKSPEAYEKWLEYQRHAMMFVDPELRERLMECHKKVGPISQHDDIVTIDKFDVADRIGELKAPLTLIRGVDDPGQPPEYELEIHEAVPGSKYVKLSGAGHFPMAEKPQEVNQAIEEMQARVG